MEAISKDLENIISNYLTEKYKKKFNAGRSSYPVVPGIHVTELDEVSTSDLPIELKNYFVFVRHISPSHKGEQPGFTWDARKKKWYVLNGKEYSTELSFFYANQITFSKSTLDRYKVYSRLDGTLFESMPWKESKSFNFAHAKEIHEKLLAGEYGQGKIIE